MMLSKSFKHYLNIHKSYLRLLHIAQRPVSNDTTIQNAIMNIPSYSSVLISGFNHQLVPNELINTLAHSKAQHLTLLTNISISDSALQSLFEKKGKVKRIITSFEGNRNCRNFDAEMVDTNTFIKACSTDGLGEYALIRSQFMDGNGCHYWIGSNMGSLLMAKWAKYFTIAQVDKFAHIEGAKDSLTKLDKIFVNLTTLCEQDVKENDVCYDVTIEPMVKRALTELNNNDVVFFSKKVDEVIKNFYMPKHINLNVLNRQINEKWLSSLDWFAWVKKINICIVEIEELSENGDIKLNLTQEDCMIRDLLINLSPTATVIAILNPKLNKSANDLYTIKKQPNLIIMDKGVFRLDEKAKRFNLIERCQHADFSNLDFTFFNVFNNCLPLKIC